MATVIDSLVLEFNLDPRKFTSGQKEMLVNLRKLELEALKSGRAVESEGKKMGEHFANLKRETLALLGVFLGGRGIKEAFNFIVGLDAATGRVAKVMNTSVKDVSMWGGAIEQVGGRAEEATAALQGLSSDVNAFLIGAGGGGALALFNKLGIRLYDQNKQLKTASQLYQELGNAIQKEQTLHGSAHAAALLATVPGMNQSMMNLLLDPDFSERLRKAIEAGTPSPEEIKRMQDYQASVAVLERSMTSLWRSIVDLAAPALSKAASSLAGLFQKWNVSPGTPEADKIEQDFYEHLHGRFGTPGDLMSKIKKGAGSLSPQTSALMGLLGAISGLEISSITSLDDSYHKRLGGSHPKGLGLDFTIGDPTKSAQAVARVRAHLAAAGIPATVIDEYKNPSAHATGGHIHVGLGAGAAINGAGAPAAAWSNVTNNSRGGDQSSSSIHIGAVNVYDSSGNADNVAKGVDSALRRWGVMMPANTGQQ